MWSKHDHLGSTVFELDILQAKQIIFVGLGQHSKFKIQYLVLWVSS